MQSMEERIAGKLMEKIAAISDISSIGRTIVGGSNKSINKGMLGQVMGSKDSVKNVKKVYKHLGATGAGELRTARGYKLAGPDALRVGATRDQRVASMEGRSSRIAGLEVLRRLQGR